MVDAVTQSQSQSRRPAFFGIPARDQARSSMGYALSAASTASRCSWNNRARSSALFKLMRTPVGSLSTHEISAHRISTRGTSHPNQLDVGPTRRPDGRMSKRTSGQLARLTSPIPRHQVPLPMKCSPWVPFQSARSARRCRTKMSRLAAATMLTRTKRAGMCRSAPMGNHSGHGDERFVPTSSIGLFGGYAMGWTAHIHPARASGRFSPVARSRWRWPGRRPRTWSGSRNGHWSLRDDSGGSPSGARRWPPGDGRGRWHRHGG